MGYYLQTKFRGNLKGSSVFCVDLTWNDPHANKKKMDLILAHIIIRYVYNLLCACTMKFKKKIQQFLCDY